MYRSASTFVYNVARALSVHACRDTWGGGRDAFMETTGDEAHTYVVKTHPYMEGLANYADDILLSVRPVAEAWRSMNRFMKGEEKVSWHQTRLWAEWIDEWRSHDACNYVMKWDEFAEDDGCWNALKDIAHVLGFDHLNLRHTMKHLRSELAPPEDEKDPQTLVFPNHYTGYDYADDIKPRLTVPAKEDE